MLNVLSLFSGIGAFEKALDNLGIPYNLLAYCEIDKYASKAYSIIHNVPEEKNLKDVTKVDILDIEDTVDLITYGFPCQDISNAGKQKSTKLRIRKLTPTECYKLMGFTAEDCKKASEGGVSNSQLYKQAGNSIVVNVLEAIFTSLGEKYNEFSSVAQ